MTIFKNIKSIFGGLANDGSKGDIETEDNTLEEERSETFAQVQAEYERYQAAVKEYEEATANKEPEFLREEIFNRTQRYKKKFEQKKAALRDIRDVQTLEDHAEELALKISRLRDAKIPDADEDLAKESYAAGQELERKLEDAEIENEIKEEQAKRQAERYSVPGNPEGEEKKDELEIGPPESSEKTREKE